MLKTQLAGSQLEEKLPWGGRAGNGLEGGRPKKAPLEPRREGGEALHTFKPPPSPPPPVMHYARFIPPTSTCTPSLHSAWNMFFQHQDLPLGCEKWLIIIRGKGSL